jgi:hypothetical protein
MKRHYAVLSAAGLLALGAGAAHAGSVIPFTTIIDPVNPTFTQALGINDSSTIVGYGNATTFNGFQFTLPNNFTRENVPGADGGTQVVGISGGGTTVGFSITGGVTSGFASQNGTTFTPVNQPGTAFNQLLGINKVGTTAAGYSSTDPAGATLQKAYTVSGGPSFTSPVFTNIDALLPKGDPAFNSQATGVNDSGTVVGFFDTTGTGLFSSFEDVGGTVTPFQPFGSTNSQALGINDLGDIVGDYFGADGLMHGYIDINGQFTSFDPTGSTGTTINGINDLLQIVGFYVDAATGNTIGFVTTVPEPATLMVFLSGLAGLALIRRRRA